MNAETLPGNQYVEDYYDKQVGALQTSYTDDRWHQSPQAELEYKQTKRSLFHALGGKKYQQLLEVGPGDGVWTKDILSRVSGTATLVEQSESMLKGARERLRDITNLDFIHADIMEASLPEGNDLVVAMRCFEYFSDKKGALKKIAAAMVPQGTLIIVTKNADLRTRTGVQHKPLHRGQVTETEMRQLLADTGFKVTEVYPATMRWMTRYGGMRALFDLLQYLSMHLSWFRVPLVTQGSTESYLYKAERI